MRTGRQYTALELLELGAIDYVAEPGEGLDMLHKLMRRREHQKAGHAAMNAVDRLIRPLAMQELHDVAKIWVDCALKLSPRGLEWMQRLYQRQLSIFGRPLETAAEYTAAERALPGRRSRVTNRRVAITGLGVVSPHGCDVGVMFDRLMRGESAVRRITLSSGGETLLLLRLASRTIRGKRSRADSG